MMMMMMMIIIIIIINVTVITHNYFIARRRKKPETIYFVNLKQNLAFLLFYSYCLGQITKVRGFSPLLLISFISSEWLL